MAVEIGAQRRLERKARSRSDAPRFIVEFTALPSIIGTIDGNGVRTVADIFAIVRNVIAGTTECTISIGVVTVTRRASPRVTPTW